jgi:hypothetical protein
LDATWVIVVLCTFLLITVVSHAIQIYVVYHSQRQIEEMQRQHNDLVSIQMSQAKTETQKAIHAAEELKGLITRLFGDPLNDPKNGG